MQEPQEATVQSLVGEDPLDKEMATHSSILAWEIPWTEDREGWQAIVHGFGRVRHDLVTRPSPPPPEGFAGRAQYCNLRMRFCIFQTWFSGPPQDSQSYPRNSISLGNDISLGSPHTKFHYKESVHVIMEVSIFVRWVRKLETQESQWFCSNLSAKVQELEESTMWFQP